MGIKNSLANVLGMGMTTEEKKRFNKEVNRLRKNKGLMNQTDIHSTFRQAMSAVKNNKKTGGGGSW